MSFKYLFTEATLGSLNLPYRIVMAPMTRSRSAQPGDIPQAMNVEYYKQRSSAALIITEASQISPQGKGYTGTPGIYSSEQIQGWKAICEAVHAQGSRVFIQLWHVGRISHSSLQPDGALPVAPSAIAATGQVFTDQGLLDFETPRALKLEEIPSIVEQYRQAAINAKEAGFDGVEIHAANGYLLDQFLRDGSNKRTDSYGGSMQNRVRLILEVTQAVTSIWGGDRVGIRISPTGTFNDMSDSEPQALYQYLVEALNPFKLAYLHVVERFGVDSDTNFDFNALRKTFEGAYMANGSYTAESAEASLANMHCDFISFGVPFIANPDLPRRFKRAHKLNTADQSTFYGGDERGYTDYPSMEDEK
ncbi:MAG: alkene reductase [Methyloprofundus sp.]|nr:alkene reductase [Methyloprofundus sp.]MDT8424721.1 alkene reductase [Methyloprofundus sp.]